MLAASQRAMRGHSSAPNAALVRTARATMASDSCVCLKNIWRKRLSANAG